MQINHLYEAAELKRYQNWKKPSVQTLKEDYEEFKHKEGTRWENRARSILMRWPVFTDFEDFKTAIGEAEVKEIDWGFIRKVDGISVTTSIGSLKSLVSTYSTPRDVNRIISGFKNEEQIPMPIILKGEKGMWMMSGNTRTNAALILGYKPKVIIINASQRYQG